MIDPSLPLIDLHRHLDGNVRLETILELGRQHNIDLPAQTIDELRPFVQVFEPQPGVMAFISKFRWMIEVLVDYKACRRVAYENVEDALHEGIDYIELRFSPWFMSETHKLNPQGVVEAVCDGITAGEKDFDIKVNLIGILSRTYGEEVARQELNALLAHHNHIVALDLAGDEVNYPGSLFNDHFKAAHQVGWQVTAHAGESGGPQNIWQAILGLGARRIGHAVAATKDEALMDYMVENRIGIETNLTSNVQTCTVKDYASHPMREFLERGLLASINTDDPGVSGIDLPFEYQVAAPAAGLSQAQIRQAQYNALETAFLSATEKEILLSKKQHKKTNR